MPGFNILSMYYYDLCHCPDQLKRYVKTQIRPHYDKQIRFSKVTSHTRPFNNSRRGIRIRIAKNFRDHRYGSTWDFVKFHQLQRVWHAIPSFSLSSSSPTCSVLLCINLERLCCCNIQLIRIHFYTMDIAYYLNGYLASRYMRTAGTPLKLKPLLPW